LQWTEFKDICKKAFCIVRQNANIFINLLNMMLSTGEQRLSSHSTT